eukprot:EG_transcript_428
MGSIFYVVLLFFLQFTKAAKVQITQITFDSDASATTNPYTRLYVSYTVLEDILPVYQDSSGTSVQGFVRLTVPDTMSINDNGVSPPFLQFPNSPAWSYYSTDDFPILPPFGRRIQVQAYINGSATLPAGTTGVFIVQDVRVPNDCRFPGVYQFQISNAIATYRPVHHGVLCPELTNLQVSFDKPWYDSMDAVLTASAMVDYYDMIVPAQDGVAVPVQLLFPQQTTPNTFVLDSASVLGVSSFIDGSNIATYWPPSGAHNITSTPSSPSGVLAQPSISRFYNPTYHTIAEGTLITLNVTLVDLPWDCTPNQMFCITVGYFTGCGVVPSPVIGCPVFSRLDADFFPSLYSSPQSTLRLGLQILNPAQPLFAKSKYKVVVTFPANQGYGLSYAGIQAAPLGRVAGSGGTQMFGFTNVLTHTAIQPPTVEFYLAGANDTGTWNAGDVYLPSYGFFNLSNISLPQDCSLLGNWTLQIGPWTVQSATSREVTGCADLSNLNVHFSTPYQSSIGVSAVFSFDVQRFDLPMEALRLTLPYYSGTSQTFQVWLTLQNQNYFQVDGLASPNLTVYKGLSYHFNVQSALPFALLSDPTTLYVNGVTVNGITPVTPLTTTGTVDWVVPLGAGPSSILYGNPTNPTPGPYGTILIVERPRGVVVDNTSFVSDSGVAKASQGVYSEAFQTWQALDPPTVTVQSDGLGNTNYTYTVFRSLAAGARPVPEGRLNFTLRNVALPAECSPLAPVALRFGPWSTSTTISGAIQCPQLSNLQVRLSTNVCNEVGVVVYFTFQVSSAPLFPSTVRALFPPDAGFWFDSPSIQAFSWTGGTPIATNYSLVEVSVLQAFSTGLPTSVGQNLTIAVQGIVNPSSSGLLGCQQPLGNFSLLVGKWRVDSSLNDRFLCPVLSNFDVLFTPNANQSALTNAVITFTTSDSIDPRFIQVLVPDGVDTSQAQFTSVMGWTLGGLTNAANILTVDVVGGSRIPAGTYNITLANVRLPRANCTDLGDWGLQIGTSLSIVGNPVSDVVKNCVTLSDLTVTFSPDAEQGQLVNMTLAFLISENPLGFVAGDSSWLTVIPSAVSGVQFTTRSKVVDTLGGTWSLAGDPVENRTNLYQSLSRGKNVPVNTRTSFTVTNVQLPSRCPEPGVWEVAIGIWRVRQTPPANGGSLTMCPVISHLEVSYTPNVPGSENVEALVNFTVDVVRLRPQPGQLRLNFPAASDITFTTGVTLSGLADWSPLAAAQIVDPHIHPGSQETTYSEIAFVQSFRGSPLEPGSYSFRLKGVNLPDNSCNDLGLYRLAVGNWSSPWTDPQLDTLTCRGLVSPINVTVSPAGLTRLATGASYTFDFVVPDCRYNQIEVTFPADFNLSNSSSQLTAYSGFDPSTSTVTVPAANKFVIQSINQTCYQTPTLPSEAYRRVVLTVSNVQVGNSCDSGLFSIATRTCGLFDRSNGQAPKIWMCVASDGDATGSVSTQTAMPTGCNVCNACYKLFTNTVDNVDVYECYLNGIRFQR